MKTQVTLLSFMILLQSYQGNAQAPDWTRLLQTSTYPAQSVNVVTADAGNNYYFAAGISGPVSYNLVNYTSTGIRDLLISKVSNTGIIQWVRQFNAATGGSLAANAIKTDGSGNLYVSGDFTGTATFGTSVLTSSASVNAFMAKFDASGNPLWATSFLSTGTGNSKIAYDAGGNSYLISKSNKLIKFSSSGVLSWEQSYTNRTLQAIAVSGPYLYLGGALQPGSPTNFGTISLSPLGGLNTGFIVRADADGVFNNSIIAGGSTTGLGSSVADFTVDNTGNLIITGCYTSNLTLGLLSNTSPAILGKSYAFLAKCNNNLEFEWISSSTAFVNSNMYNYEVSYDNTYNSIHLYCQTGIFSYWNALTISIATDKQFVISFNSTGTALTYNILSMTNVNTFHSGQSGESVSGGSYYYEGSPDYGNFFIKKYNMFMIEEWTSASTNSTSGYVSISSIKHDEGGNTYIQARTLGKCNYFGTNISTNNFLTIISKHDISGTMLWINKIQDQSPANFGCSFTLDKDNNVITTGLFNDELQVGPNKIFTPNSLDAYVARFSSDGKFLWASPADIGTSVSKYITVAADNAGNVIVSGVRSPDNYLLKFNSEGTRLWTKIIPMASNFSSLVSVDPSNNIYLSSEVHLDSYPELSPIVIDGVTITQSGSDGATALVKFNPDGVAQWGKLYGGVTGGTIPDGWACDIDNDAAGNTYLWGWCKNGAVFGSTVLTNPFPSNQDYSFYLTKINSSGDVVWAKGIYGKKYGFNYGNMQDLDESGNIYVGGHFKDLINIDGVEYAPSGVNDNFTSKFTNDGTFEWIKTIPSNSVIINSIDVSEEDVLSLGGAAGIDAVLGGFNYEKKGGNTAIVATLGTLAYISISTDTLYAASPANSTASFTINANTAWTLSSDATWLVPDITGGSGNSVITLTAQQNSLNTFREANITVFRDGKKMNTIVVLQYGVPISAFPYLQQFSTWPPASWVVDQGSIPWEHDDSDHAFVNFWYYDAPHYAVMKMPLFDFSSLSNPELTFDWSHKYYSPYEDKLVILATTDWKTWKGIWQKQGNELNSNDGALNEAPGTFTTTSISLSEYAGEPFVGIAFMGVSAYGPNLYIDNVSISDPIASAPEAVTEPASQVLQTSAILNGTVTPNSALTNITFEYGLTSAYGSSVLANPASAEGSLPFQVTAVLSGLTTNTVYHFRVVAVNSEGTDYGNDMTFTPSGCLRLNYSTENVPGTYSDLGSSGGIISTLNFDNANSAPQEIGFSFDFNCQSFTQFILNTNGYIKLGNTPPSSELFFSGNNTNDGILSSTNSSDINILAPFTHDLVAGSSPAEYRVSTTGSAPNRVCTIQFKNLRDKNVIQQYDNINFQVKLYETTNIIEYVYGDWTPSAGSSSPKSAECGIKGNTPDNDHLITVSKTSIAAWNTALFQHYNYTGNALNFGNPPDRPVPDAGCTFRFKPMKNIDASVIQIYSLTKLAIPVSNPHVIKAAIRNTGLLDLSDITVTLSVTGANTFTSTKTISSIYINSNVTISFDSFSPANTGINNITVTVENDEDNSNNSLNLSQNVNVNTISYADENPAAGSIRYDYLCLTRFSLTGTRAITGIRVKLSNDYNNVDNIVYGVILNSSGELLGRSADFLITEEDNSNYILLSIPDAPEITNSDFYVGLATTTPVGAVYYPTAVQNEFPTRQNTYYYTYSMDGGGSIYSYVGYRFIIEAIVKDPIITDIENSTTINQPSGDINIYPNPATDHLVIDMTEYDEGTGCNIRIINSLGIPVYESVIPSDRYELDVSSWLLRGYYLLYVYEKNNVLKTIRKIIIQ